MCGVHLHVHLCGFDRVKCRFHFLSVGREPSPLIGLTSFINLKCDSLILHIREPERESGLYWWYVKCSMEPVRHKSCLLNQHTDEPLVYHIYLIKFLFGLPNQNFEGCYFNTNGSFTMKLLQTRNSPDSKLSKQRVFYEHCCLVGTSQGQDDALTVKSPPEQDT